MGSGGGGGTFVGNVTKNEECLLKRMQCNVLIQIRTYSNFQHSVIGKRTIGEVGGLEYECPGWKNFEKLTIEGPGQLIRDSTVYGTRKIVFMSYSISWPNIII